VSRPRAARSSSARIQPLGILLLVASAVSAFLGEVINAAIMIAIVILGAGVNFFQTYRSQRAVERLRAQVAPTATSLAPSAQFTIS
jgi:Mg2+-importing ATPase